MPRLIGPKTRSAYLGGALVLFLLLSFGGQLLVILLADRLAPALAAHEAFPWLLALLPNYLIALPLAWLLLARVPTERPAAPDAPPLKPRHWLLALLLCFGLTYIGSAAGNLLMQIVAWLTGNGIPNPVSDLLLSSSPLLSFVSTVIAAPLGEEFLFRRLLIDRARPFGERAAVLFSALAFAAFHLNLYQFFYAFLLGLVFAYVYVKTGRLRYTVALHAVLNLFGGVISTELLKPIYPLLSGEAFSPAEVIRLLPAMLLYLSYAGLMICTAGAAIAMIILLRRRISFAPGILAPRSLWCGPAVILFFCLCALLTLLLS